MKEKCRHRRDKRGCRKERSRIWRAMQRGKRVMRKKGWQSKKLQRAKEKDLEGNGKDAGVEKSGVRKEEREVKRGGSQRYECEKKGKK